MGGPAYKYTSSAAFSYDDPHLDQRLPLTYNSSIHGRNETVPIYEARHRLVWLSGRHLNLTEELRVGGLVSDLRPGLATTGAQRAAHVSVHHELCSMS